VESFTRPAATAAKPLILAASAGLAVITDLLILLYEIRISRKVNRIVDARLLREQCSKPNSTGTALDDSYSKPGAGLLSTG
jgi:hypothetical protein